MQYGKAQHVHAELPGQELRSVLNPLPAMVVVYTGNRVGSEQERASDAAVDTMINADFSGFEQKPATNTGHDNRSGKTGWQMATNEAS